MRLFFLTIPKPLGQHPILKKIIHSAIFKDLREKLPDLSITFMMHGAIECDGFIKNITLFRPKLIDG